MKPPSTIEGLPFSLVRELARILKLGGAEFNTVQVLQQRAKLTDEDAQNHLAALIRAGYVDAAESHGLHRLTDAGSQLATKGLRRITSARKDQLIRLVIERAEKIAAADDFAFEVEQLVLFGSALQDDLPDYGDVDVGSAIVFKRIYPDIRAALQVEQEITGIPYYDPVRGHPQVRIERFLKSRSPSIHLQELDQVRRLGVPHRVIYQRPP
jgi:hypothetical protein